MEGKYTTLTLDEALKRQTEDRRPWALCYIDSIPQEEYDFKVHRDVPNPEYMEGVSEMKAYFTPCLEKQWGDDWGDTMGEASIPYTDVDDGIDEILVVPFAVPDQDLIQSKCGSIEGPTFTWDIYASHLCPMIINRCRMPWMTVMMYPKGLDRLHPYHLKVFPLNAGTSLSGMQGWLDDIRKFINENYKSETNK